ncbi:1831_t:CDS:2, partial [Acaulospora colombiana]
RFALGRGERSVSDNGPDEQHLIVERLRHLAVNDSIPPTHTQELEEAAEAEAQVVDVPADYGQESELTTCGLNGSALVSTLQVTRPPKPTRSIYRLVQKGKTAAVAIQNLDPGLSHQFLAPSSNATISYWVSLVANLLPSPLQWRQTNREDVEIGMLTIEGTPLPSSFGSPLTRTARRASPTRALTMPLNNDELDYSSSIMHRRPSHGANTNRLNQSRRSEHRSLQLAGAGSIPAATPHLIYAAEQTSSFTDDEEDDIKK